MRPRTDHVYNASRNTRKGKKMASTMTLMGRKTGILTMRKTMRKMRNPLTAISKRVSSRSPSDLVLNID